MKPNFLNPSGDAIPRLRLGIVGCLSFRRSRAHFIDVKVGKSGQKYLTITESEGAGKESHRVMIFADHVDEFADAVDNAKKAMK
jgi:hypothetical protein